MAVPGRAKNPSVGRHDPARFHDRFTAAGSGDVATVSYARLARATPAQRLPDALTCPRPTLSVTRCQTTCVPEPRLWAAAQSRSGRPVIVQIRMLCMEGCEIDTRPHHVSPHRGSAAL